MHLQNPFALNLRQQSTALCAHLRILPSSAAILTDSPYAFLPRSHLDLLLAVAADAQQGSNPSTRSTVTPEDLIDVLSDLLELPPLTAKVAELFRPLLMVLMARWVDRTRGGREEWVRRIIAGASLAEGIEEVWP